MSRILLLKQYTIGVIFLVFLLSGVDGICADLPGDDAILEDSPLPSPVEVGGDLSGQRRSTGPIQSHSLSRSRVSLFVTPEGIRFASGKKEFVLQDRAIRFSLKNIFGNPVSAEGGEKCLICHNGIEVIGKDHNFTCTTCHLGNASVATLPNAHKGMVSNPSDLHAAERFCGTCHEGHVKRVKSSLMSTAAGEINTTRYQWGAQDSEGARYAVVDIETLKKIPSYSESHHLVDDMLRKKCLRCHLNAVSPNRLGEYRATGCAACHMVYSNDGKSRSPDMAIQSVQRQKRKIGGSGMNERRGYPLRHVFTSAIPSVQCVRCHSGNRVGTEYIGMVEHDSDIKYNPPGIDGDIVDEIYGSRQHALLPDIHYEKGLHCIDCHPQRELEGNGTVYSHIGDATVIRCEDCHGTPQSPPSYAFVFQGDHELKTALASRHYRSLQVGDRVVITSKGVKLGNVKKIDNEVILTSKVTGKEHRVPLLIDLKKQPVSHTIPRHMKNIECHACHSAWTATNWGYTMMREDTRSSFQWSRWWFTDPVLQNTIFSLAGTRNYQLLAPQGRWMKKEPISLMGLDWLTAKQSREGITGKKSAGLWWDFSVRKNWEQMIGMINARGKVSAAKPDYQWIVRNKGKEVALKKGTLLRPYVPHTQRKEARSCEDCHQNRYFVGLGKMPFDEKGLPSGELENVVGRGNSLIPPVSLKGTRFFSEDERERLLMKSRKYKVFRYLDLQEKGWKSSHLAP